MTGTADRNHGRPPSGKRVKSVEAARRCPSCGRMLYMKPGDCSGMIAIKCQKCGRTVNMNLALRKRNG